MQKILFLVFALYVTAASAAIPNPHIYQWGTIEVPENYSFDSKLKVNIYWEKLKADSAAPEAIVMINGGPGMEHDGFHQPDGKGGYLKDWFYALRTNFDIYYFDQRGTGKSSPLNYDILSRKDMRQYGTANICRDLEELRKNVIKKEKIAVLGESYGGMVALNYAIMYPNRVSKLIIHDSSPTNNYFTHMHKNFSEMLAILDLKIPGVRQNLIKTVQMFDAGQVDNAYGVPISGLSFLSLIINYTYSFRGQIIIARLAEDIVADGRSAILDALLGGIIGRPERASYSSIPVTILLVQCLEMFDEKNIASLKNGPDYQPWNYAWVNGAIHQSRADFKRDVRLEAFSSFNLTNQLSKITAPTLVLVGETDFICPPVYADIIKNGIGERCRVIKVKNAAHSGFVEQNEFVVGKIRDFLIGYWPGHDYRIKPIEEFLSRNVSAEEALSVWLEGARRLGLTD